MQMNGRRDGAGHDYMRRERAQYWPPDVGAEAARKSPARARAGHDGAVLLDIYLEGGAPTFASTPLPAPAASPFLLSVLVILIGVCRGCRETAAHAAQLVERLAILRNRLHFGFARAELAPL